MTERQRERELVLAPNEFAYVLDTTKGHINCYVGPNKTSLAQTDQPVMFNRHSKRFEYVDLQRATQLFPTAPANWYMVLKNPSKTGQRPSPGVSNSMTELEIGRKVVIRGPASFPLWPGQMARVIEGHRLEPNQYLHVRIHDAQRARDGWADALALDETSDPPAFDIGETLVIRGTDVAFFIPPDGVEVVTDDQGHHVRDAVTLNALEYCILERDDGTRRFVRGESVVFPESGERFVTEAGARKHRAVELSTTTGIHVKVVASYEDDDGTHAVGEELFLTGQNKIYFPRAEHIIVRYDEQGHALHHAVAIPAGEGRYVLDRASGAVAKVVGPRMFLPDPRREVIVRRVLSDKECALLYPGNERALALNRALRTPGPAQAPASSSSPAQVASPPPRRPNEVRNDWIPPRVLTLDDGDAGVVNVQVWPGYAVQVVNRAGERRVELGPVSLLLDYDETLAPLALSTGTPKTDDRLLRTAYLHVTGNKVSDAFSVVTSDMVECWVSVSYRVDFTGAEPSKWFEVDNYVRLLCEHGRSIIARACRHTTIRELFVTISDVVRDAVLGAAEEGERTGRLFTENAMRVYDIELLEFGVLDEDVSDILTDAQRDTIASAISVSRQTTAVEEEKRLLDLERERANAAHATRKLQLHLDGEHAEMAMAVRRKKRELEASLAQMERENELLSAEELTRVIEQTVAGRKLEHDADIARQADHLELRTRELASRVDAATKHAQAFSPHLVEALQRLGDEELLGRLSENFSELAAVEGRGLLETAKKFLDFVPASHLPRLGGDAE